MRIVEPSKGTVELEGVDITKESGKALRSARTRMQMIFQDPISSLNPRRRVQGHRRRTARLLEDRGRRRARRVGQ